MWNGCVYCDVSCSSWRLCFLLTSSRHQCPPHPHHLISQRLWPSSLPVQRAHSLWSSSSSSSPASVEDASTYTVRSQCTSGTRSFENLYSPCKHGRTINSTNQDTNTNQIKTKQTRKCGNYSDVLPLKAARRDSISNLTSLGASNLSCKRTQCHFI